jgi:hypothetical protein
MPTYANITPIATTDGLTYASSVPLTSTEADLYSGTAIDGQDPVSVTYGQAIVAVVTLKPQSLTGQLNAYVVMQQDMGDGVWVDIAWCIFQNAQATVTFVLSGGGVGNNAFQQRAVGQFPTPQTNGSNAMPLAGRVRFVGKSILTGGSSAAPGLPAQVAATIRYKLLGLR